MSPVGTLSVHWVGNISKSHNSTSFILSSKITWKIISPIKKFSVLAQLDHCFLYLPKSMIDLCWSPFHAGMKRLGKKNRRRSPYMLIIWLVQAPSSQLVLWWSCNLDSAAQHTNQTYSCECALVRFWLAGTCALYIPIQTISHVWWQINEGQGLHLSLRYSLPAHFIPLHSP